jgi:predicted RNase H-like nuclease (RuvC/YqgF family)
MVDNMKEIIADKNKTLEKLVDKIKELNEVITSKDREILELQQMKGSATSRGQCSPVKHDTTPQGKEKKSTALMTKLYQNMFSKETPKPHTLTSQQSSSNLRGSYIEKVTLDTRRC